MTMGRTKRLRMKKRDKQLAFSISCDRCFINLTVWMRQNNWFPLSNVHPYTFNDTGRGLLTKRRIKSGDTLISIPIHLLITTETVENTSIACVLHGDTKISFIAQEVISLFLTWEKFLGETSFWFAYIQSLPSAFSLPIFCTIDELKLLPHFVLKEVVKLKEKIQKSFCQLKSETVNVKYCNYCQKNTVYRICDTVFNFKFDDYLWAWCIVNTRSVYLLRKNSSKSINITGKDSLALVPYLDMFNHSNEVSMTAQLTEDGKFYSIVTITPFEKHSQVFIHYGHHSNMFLYLEYGFIIPNNKYDFVNITLREIVESTKKLYTISDYRNRIDYINSHKLDTNLFCNVDGVSFNVKAVVFVLTSNICQKKLHQIIYTKSYSTDQVRIIKNVELKLLEMKLNEFSTTLETMKNRKQCTVSFEVAKSLVEEYINMLNKAVISLNISVK